MPAHVRVQPGEQLERAAARPGGAARWRMSASSTRADQRPTTARARAPSSSAIRSTSPGSALAGSSSSGRTTAGTSRPTKRPARPRAARARAGSRARARAPPRTPAAASRRRRDEVRRVAGRSGAARRAARSRSPASRARASRTHGRWTEWPPGSRSTRSAGGELEQRRDREARAQQVVAAEAVGDHAAPVIARIRRIDRIVCRSEWATNLVQWPRRPPSARTSRRLRRGARRASSPRCARSGRRGAVRGLADRPAADGRGRARVHPAHERDHRLVRARRPRHRRLRALDRPDRARHGPPDRPQGPDARPARHGASSTPPR